MEYYQLYKIEETPSATRAEQAGSYPEYLEAVANDAADRCTSCGKCYQACPTASHSGFDLQKGPTVVGELIAITRGDETALHSDAARWLDACNSSGQCIAACPEGINVRQWVSLARVKKKLALNSDKERTTSASLRFRNMSQAVRLLSSMQIPAATLGKITSQGASRKAELVFYTGCNVLRTPHIVFNVMDIFEELGVSFEVVGGASNCCGVLQFVEGDLKSYERIGGRTYKGFAEAGAKRVVTWCGTCQKQFHEFREGYDKPSFELGHVTNYLAENLDELKTKFKVGRKRRIVIHEHTGIEGVLDSVRTLMAAVPGIEIMEVPQDSNFSYSCAGTAARYPDREREIHHIVAENAAAVGADTVVTIYHACQRQLSGAEAHYNFEVLNFTDILAEAIGRGGRRDYYKQYRVGGEMHQAVEAAKEYLQQIGMSFDEEKLALLTREIFNEVGIAGSQAGFVVGMQALLSKSSPPNDLT